MKKFVYATSFNKNWIITEWREEKWIKNFQEMWKSEVHVIENIKNHVC